MNILNRFLSAGSQPRKRTMREQLDDIEGAIDELTDAVGKIHSDMWDKLTALQEQGAQRPSIVLGMPSGDGTEITLLEPLEPVAEIEPVAGSSEEVAYDANEAE